LESSKAHSKRPALPRLTSKPIVAEPDPETDTDSDSRPLSTLSTPSTGVTTPDIPASVPFDPDNKGFPNPDEPTDEQKLAAIVEEFGDIANLMESNDGSTAESERILAESKGSLFK
jgi:sterol 3beta-glucosyltransferase